MGFFSTYIEKVATNIDVDKEKELIKRIQKNPNDTIAWKQLTYRFRPMIQNAIRKAGVTTPNVARETLEAAVMDQFRKSIMSYDPSIGRPSTYIYDGVYNTVRKINNANIHETKMPVNLSEKSPYVHNALVYLKSLGNDNPTDEQVEKTIKDVFGKKITLSEVKRIRDYTRDELSANVTVGEEGEGTRITYGDIMFTGTDQGIDDYIKSQRDEEILNKALNKLTPQEKDLLMEYERMGKYKGRGKISFAELAFNNNLGSAWQASKKIKEIKAKLREELTRYDR